MPEQLSNELIFGEFAADGKVKRQPRLAAHPEGEKIESGDARIRIKDTPFFYYVKHLRLFSDGERAEVETRVRSTAPDAPVEPKQVTAPSRSGAPRQVSDSQKESTGDNSNN